MDLLFTECITVWDAVLISLSIVSLSWAIQVAYETHVAWIDPPADTCPQPRANIKLSSPTTKETTT